jgi:hypothetical protein
VGAPGPGAGVIGIVEAESVTAGLAEPELRRAGAGGAIESGRGEGGGLIWARGWR